MRVRRAAFADRYAVLSETQRCSEISIPPKRPVTDLVRHNKYSLGRVASSILTKVEPIAIQVFRRATGMFAIVASAQDLSRALDAPIQDARYFTN